MVVGKQFPIFRAAATAGAIGAYAFWYFSDKSDPTLSVPPGWVHWNCWTGGPVPPYTLGPIFEMRPSGPLNQCLSGNAINPVTFEAGDTLPTVSPRIVREWYRYIGDIHEDTYRRSRWIEVWQRVGGKGSPDPEWIYPTPRTVPAPITWPDPFAPPGFDPAIDPRVKPTKEPGHSPEVERGPRPSPRPSPARPLPRPDPARGNPQPRPRPDRPRPRPRPGPGPGPRPRPRPRPNPNPNPGTGPVPGTPPLGPGQGREPPDDGGSLPVPKPRPGIPAVIITDPGMVPVVRPDPRVRDKKPKGGTKEKKFVVHNRFSELIGAVTETMDIVSALYKAVPWCLRPVGFVSPVKMAATVYEQFEFIDWRIALGNIYANAQEDAVIGKVERWVKASPLQQSMGVGILTAIDRARPEEVNTGTSFTQPWEDRARRYISMAMVGYVPPKTPDGCAAKKWAAIRTRANNKLYFEEHGFSYQHGLWRDMGMAGVDRLYRSGQISWEEREQERLRRSLSMDWNKTAKRRKRKR